MGPTYSAEWLIAKGATASTASCRAPSSTLVIWLAADSEIAEQALKEMLAFYP